MRLLLDSHALIWWLAGVDRLPHRVRDAIDLDTNAVFVSAASAWEICTKYRIGKLSQAAILASSFVSTVTQRGFQLLDITVKHAEMAGAMPGAHKDPFDRMLVAQALSENLTLISNETAFDALGVSRLW